MIPFSSISFFSIVKLGKIKLYNSALYDSFILIYGITKFNNSSFRIIFLSYSSKFGLELITFFTISIVNSGVSFNWSITSWYWAGWSNEIFCFEIEW